MHSELCSPSELHFLFSLTNQIKFVLYIFLSLKWTIPLSLNNTAACLVSLSGWFSTKSGGSQQFFSIFLNFEDSRGSSSVCLLLWYNFFHHVHMMGLLKHQILFGCQFFSMTFNEFTEVGIIHLKSNGFTTRYNVFYNRCLLFKSLQVFSWCLNWNDLAKIIVQKLCLLTGVKFSDNITCGFLLVQPNQNISISSFTSIRFFNNSAKPLDDDNFISFFFFTMAHNHRHTLFWRIPFSCFFIISFLISIVIKVFLLIATLHFIS